jgi:hypothetical protein
MEGETIDIVSGTNFTPGKYEILEYISSNTVRLNKCPTVSRYRNLPYPTYAEADSASNGTGYVIINPKYYRGIKVDLGNREIENISRWSYRGDRADLADKIKNNTFVPMQNVTYFWFVDILDLGAPSTFNPTDEEGESAFETVDWRGYREITDAYIGTSMSATNSGLFEITGVGTLFQSVRDNIIIPLGYYYVGSMPYKEVSAQSGEYIAKPQWEDREDGLYELINAHWNYTSYARKVARLEYNLLKNINGEITPITSANLDLTLDGFLYYGIKLLTRINIVNTLQTGIYKNSNGFPVSVKEIEINSSDMRVHLILDNRLSQEELEKLHSRYPDEPEPYEEQRTQITIKWDLANWESWSYNELERSFDDWQFGWDKFDSEEGLV